MKTLELAIVLDAQLFKENICSTCEVLQKQLQRQLEAATIRADCTLVTISYQWFLPGMQFKAEIYKLQMALFTKNFGASCPKLNDFLDFDQQSHIERMADLA